MKKQIILLVAMLAFAALLALGIGAVESRWSGVFSEDFAGVDIIRTHTITVGNMSDLVVIVRFAEDHDKRDGEVFEVYREEVWPISQPKSVGLPTGSIAPGGKLTLRLGGGIHFGYKSEPSLMRFSKYLYTEVRVCVDPRETIARIHEALKFNDTCKGETLRVKYPVLIDMDRIGERFISSPSKNFFWIMGNRISGYVIGSTNTPNPPLPDEKMVVSEKFSYQDLVRDSSDYEDVDP